MANPLLDSNVGGKIIANHRIMDIQDPDTENLAVPNSENQYYEVVRCIGGIPLFLEDHLDRLQASTAGSIAWDRGVLQNEVRMLIEADRIVNGNIKIVLTGTMRLLYESRHYYPAAEEYLAGVRVGLLRWNRVEPNVKRVREDYKEAIRIKLEQEGAFGPYFETLLVDKDGCITEGSRTNVFFVKGTLVFTAPDEEILKGITRKYVLQAIERAGATLISQKLPVQNIDSLKEGGSAFLSGTSIGVLPVCAIEDTRIASAGNEMVQRIMKEYEDIIRDYLLLYRNHKK